MATWVIPFLISLQCFSEKTWECPGGVAHWLSQRTEDRGFESRRGMRFKVAMLSLLTLFALLSCALKEKKTKIFVISYPDYGADEAPEDGARLPELVGQVGQRIGGAHPVVRGLGPDVGHRAEIDQFQNNWIIFANNCKIAICIPNTAVCEKTTTLLCRKINFLDEKLLQKELSEHYST
jgi:hypothetical protein